jgi:hypothetical protein
MPLPTVCRPPCTPNVAQDMPGVIPDVFDPAEVLPAWQTLSVPIADNTPYAVYQNQDNVTVMEVFVHNPNGYTIEVATTSEEAEGGEITEWDILGPGGTLGLNLSPGVLVWVRSPVADSNVQVKQTAP